MRALYFFTILFISFINLQFGIEQKPNKEVVITSEEKKLYDLISEYREAEGLPKIPLSSSLTYVAQQHSKDLVINKPSARKECNAHSWSNKGKWKGCCYTKNHRQADCMWNKPRELTNYTGNGYEIAVGPTNLNNTTYEISAQEALDSWKGSYYHNILIVNKDSWKDNDWQAIGVGIYKGFATVWFGEELDAAPSPTFQN